MTDHEFKVGDKVQTTDGHHRGTVVRIIPDGYAWPVVVQWDGGGGMGNSGHYRHSELLPVRKFKSGDRVKRDVAWWSPSVVADPAYSDRGYVRVYTNQGIVTYSEDSLDFQEEKVPVNTELEEYKKKVLAVALRTKNDPNVTFCESGFKAAMEELGLPYGPQDEYDESTVLEIVYDDHRVIALKSTDGWRYFRTLGEITYHQSASVSWATMVEYLRNLDIDLDDAVINVIA